MIGESFMESTEYQEQPEIVKDLIIKEQTSLLEKIEDVKKKLYALIINNQFEFNLPREIYEITFQFCWQRQIKIIQNTYDEDEFGLFYSIISKSQFLIDNVEQNTDIDWVEFFNQYKTKFKEVYGNLKEIIQHIKQSFSKKIQDQLSIIYNNKSQILIVYNYQFNSLSKCESTTTTVVETRIEKIQQSEITLLGFQSFENAQVYYYFQTHLNQKMFIIQLEKNNRFQYVWIQQLQNQKTEKIFTFNQQSNSLLFYYDQISSSLYIFNTQMGATVIVYDEEKKRITSEKSKKYQNGCDIYVELCYLQYFQCFLLVGQDQNICKLFPRESNSFEQLQLENKYTKVFSTGIGYYYCLANQSFIDIYNFNNQKIQHINYQDYGLNNLNILLFYNQDDWFVILYDSQQLFAQIQIKYINTSQQIVSIQQELKQEQNSNPFLDLIKGSIIKFGPSLQLLPTNNKKTDLIISQKCYKLIEGYYQLQQISETDILVKRDIFQQEGQHIEFNYFYQVLISRVPVQICTIEKSMLILLNKGQINQKMLSQFNKIKILQKVYELDFSVIEFIKTFSQMKIYIVSIMGKQSSGKSYLLNRIFGTRFGVSSARCTDGIWMSFSIIDNILFILLDCEGLFGSRRTDDEETMLLTLITSISDATILNQDLSFDRHLNKQHNKLTNITQNISGQNLFKGQLIIAVRDVNQQEQTGAQKELLTNIQQIKGSQKTSNFISKLFSDRFQLLFMSHFQAQPFENDIITLRQKLLLNAKESNNNWNDISQLTKVIKIMLVQLELQDYRTLEEIQEEDNIVNLRQRTLDLWFNNEDPHNTNIKFLNIDKTYNELFESYYNDPVRPSSLEHNLKLQQIEQKITVYMSDRAKVVKSKIDKILIQIKDNQQKEDKSKEIDSLLQNLADKYRICLQKCEYCFLQCSLRKNHEKKIIQQKFQIDDEITQNIQNLQELTTQLNESGKIQFDSHQQLIEEQERIKNQIIYQDQIENIFKILSKIYAILQINNTIENENYIDWSIKDMPSNIKLQIDEYFQKLQMPIDQNEVQLIIQNYDIEKLDKNIQNQKKKNQINNQKLQEQFEQLDKDKAEQIQQTNIMSEVQNLEIDEKQLSFLISEKQSKLDILNQDKFKLLKSLKETNITNLEQLQILQQNQRNKKQQFQQIITDINNELNKQKPMIIQKIQNQQIDELIEELIDKIDIKIQKLIPDINYLQKNISKKQAQISKLQLSDDQNIQLGSQVILDEISQLNSQIQSINQQILVHNQDKERLNIFKIEDNNYDQLCQLIIQINFQQLIDQKTQSQEQLDYIIVDISRLEEYEQIFINQQIQNEQINAIETTISQDMESMDQIKQKRMIKIQIIENLSKNNESLSNKVIQINQLQSVIMDSENEIKKLQEFKINLTQIFNLQQQLEYSIQNLQQNNQINKHQANCDKIQLQQQLNKNQQQLQQFFQIKEIVDKITDCQNQISYNQQKLEVLNQQEMSNHNCRSRSHVCEQNCQGCALIQKCKLKSGHTQIHLCENQNHQCLNNCQFCHHQCKNLYGHSQDQLHDCNNQHPCPQKCKFCFQSCDIDLAHKHEIHQCKNIDCNHKCFFNSEKFVQKCLNLCSKAHNELHDHHLCSNAHNCFKQCDRPGICYIGSYTEELKYWQTENGRFEYLNYKQNAERRQCVMLIQQNQIQHEMNFHSCLQTHCCDYSCPECNAFCIKEYNHQDKHNIYLHRNKDQQYFTSLISHIRGNSRRTVIIKDGQLTKEYNIGDNCTPETCQKSCERRGRAHYHLIPCSGENQCLQIIRPDLRVKHQQIPYIGQNSQQIQDEILCQDFWQYYNWEHPVSNLQLRDQIDMCNYYCCLCKENNFCTLPAWHTDSNDYEDHRFECHENHIFNGIDICFVVDTTQSMQEHMEIIRGAINKFQNAQQENKIKYSIVAYWDHNYPYDQNQIVVRSQDFTNYDEILNFFYGINYQYSNDHCEAMFDGLNAALKLSWRNKSKKYIILIADSPPHGSQYNNYRWIKLFQDNFETGCPCGLSETSILTRLILNDINLVILKFNKYLDKTILEFRRQIKNLKVIEQISQQDFIKQLDILICQEQIIQEITSSRIRQKQN